MSCSDNQVCKDTIYVDDIGTDLIMTIYECDCSTDPCTEAVASLTGSTSMQMFIKQPDGDLLTRTASFVTDGSDGKIHYVTVTGDFDESGEYGLQGKVVSSAGSWRTEIEYIKVQKNLS